MKTSYKIYTLSFAVVLAFAIASCKKFIQVPTPVTSLSSSNVYTNNATAAAVLTGIYTTISTNGIGSGVSSTSVYCGLSADEYGLYAPASQIDYLPFYENSLTPKNLAGGDLWSTIYPIIYVANSAIEGLTNNSDLTPAVDKQLLGEAKFVRAFCYFYLVNVYGDVALATGTDYKVNESLPRIPKATVYLQIIADLTDAQNLLSDQYLDASVLNVTPARVRPTKWAAAAMLARTYLYTGDWSDAQTEASLVIGNSSTYSLSTLNNVFLTNSSEAIWQLQPVAEEENTPEGLFFILPASGPNSSNPVFLSKNLLSAFETGDQRLVNWVSSVTDSVGQSLVTYYFPYKYKVNSPGAAVTEYEMVLRLGEQYLIRSEAEAELGDLAGAKADLNTIRQRAGLPNTSASTIPGLLSAIQHERQVELFSEWGHRWFDLKRTGAADSVMSVVTPEKGGIWNPDSKLYPLPLGDLQTDHKLVQNPGY
jgi:hypothetical protein